MEYWQLLGCQRVIPENEALYWNKRRCGRHVGIVFERPVQEQLLSFC